MTDYPPEMFPPRIVIGPDGRAPVGLPDDLREEWQGTIIPGPQEYVRADIFAAMKIDRDRMRAEVDILRNRFKDAP